MIRGMRIFSRLAENLWKEKSHEELTETQIAGSFVVDTANRRLYVLAYEEKNLERSSSAR